MSPQISKKEWNDKEQIVFLTYREMATVVALINEVLETKTEDSDVSRLLESVKTKFFVELKPVMYDEDIEKLGGE